MAFRAFLFGLASCGLFAAVAPAHAQYTVATPPAEEVAAARTCLCLEKAVQDRRFELDVRNGLFEQARGEMESLAREVEQRRPNVNPNDISQVDAFRSLLARSDAARTRYEQTVVPEQQQAVARYNSVVEQLNASCKGRVLPTYAWDAAGANLVCPKY